MRATLTTAIVILFLASTAQAQRILPNDRYYIVPQDKQPFFFQPSQISPDPVGAFGEVMGQFSDHPLSSINRNPANLSQLDERTYFYIDLKTVPEETLYTYPPVCLGCFRTFRNYQYNSRFKEKRTAQEPFLSAAIFMKPADNSGLRFGLTYQLLSENDPFYQLRPNTYVIPTAYQFPYSSQYHAPSENIPGNRDQYRTQGHFPSFYTGYEFSDRLSAGLKVSYNYYTVNGRQIVEGFGNYSDTAIPPRSTEFTQHRDVTYSHWDFSAGTRAELSDRMTAGISAGYLTGNFNQYGAGTGHQVYEDYNLNGDDYYETLLINAHQRNGFERNGHTLYASADYEYGANDHSHLKLNYRISRSDQDFNFAAHNLNFYDQERYYLYNQDEEKFWINETRRTNRYTGTGSSELWQHRLSMSYSRNLIWNIHFRSGFQINYDLDKESISELQQHLNRNYRYEETDGNTTVDREYTRGYRSPNTMKPVNYQFTGYLPLILGRSFGQQFYAELGVMGLYRSEIRKLEQVIELYSHYESAFNANVYSDRSQTTLKYNPRRHDSAMLFNAFSSISFTPNDRLRIKLMAYSDRRQLNPDRRIDEIRFQFSAEIGF